jgi:hypothetical protein
VLVWDGLSAHWSRAMRAWAAEQNWLTLERLPAYAPELNPVELLWSAIKTRELANLAGDHLADVADAADAASTESAPANNNRGPSSHTPDSQSIPKHHRTNGKLSRNPGGHAGSDCGSGRVPREARWSADSGRATRENSHVVPASLDALTRRLVVGRGSV